MFIQDIEQEYSETLGKLFNVDKALKSNLPDCIFSLLVIRKVKLQIRAEELKNEYSARLN